MKRIVYSAAFALLLGLTASAQESSHLAFKVDGGFTTAAGHAGRALDTGWSAGLGVGYNFGSYVGVMVDADYSHLGINSSTLANIGAPGGNVGITSFTLDPVVHVNPHGHFDMYVTGGGGLYHRYQNFTAPSVSSTFGFDPYFGFYPALVPSTTILSQYSVNKPGFDFGVGIAMGTKWHGKLFAEAKYNEMFDGNGFHTGYLPVTFGYRW